MSSRTAVATTAVAAAVVYLVGGADAFTAASLQAAMGSRAGQALASAATIAGALAAERQGAGGGGAARAAAGRGVP